MPQYTIPVYFEVRADVKITADSLNEAVNKVDQGDFDGHPDYDNKFFNNGQKCQFTGIYEASECMDIPVELNSHIMTEQDWQETGLTKTEWGEHNAKIEAYKASLSPVDQHEIYTKQDWQYDVRNGNTKLGYAEWVRHNLESKKGSH